jgi:hypothetical protein
MGYLCIEKSTRKPLFMNHNLIIKTGENISHIFRCSGYEMTKTNIEIYIFLRVT